ncbi:hypothetical protein, partial [Propionicimonas sp.]|uniref:hypothetical protein n=1 Tax=Propionicimonas sp. TaxID=1955623 RepID=UPI0039E2470F
DATVPAEPSAAGSWQKTAPIPIGQRYGAISLWAGSAFYIIGGTSHCGLDDQGRAATPGSANDAELCAASLPSPGRSLADGARYDPASDSWTRIADAPSPLPGGQGVVAGDAIYVRTGDENPRLFRYDLAADAWTQIPAPDGRIVGQLVSRGGELYATTTAIRCLKDHCGWLQHWDAAAGAWADATALPAGDWQGEAWVAATTDAVVLIRSTRGGGAVGSVLRDGAWRQVPALPLRSPDWLGVAGDLIVLVGGDQAAYTLDPSDPVWRRVPDAPGRGGLLGADPPLGAPRFTDGNRVSVGGDLYDPATGAWTDVPPLPNPLWAFAAFAGSGSQVLGCYVGPADSLNDCYLLTLAAAVTSAAPVPVDEWVATSPSPLIPRRNALGAWVGTTYLVIGGDCGGMASCKATIPREGAAYDPATDRWRRIASAPAELDASARWAVQGSTLYVVAAAGGQLLAYDPAVDSWRELPAAPLPGGRVGALRANDELLLAFDDAARPRAWFDPVAATWTKIPAGAYPSGGGPGSSASLTPKELVIGDVTSEKGSGSMRFRVFAIDAISRPQIDSTTTLAGWNGTGRLVTTDQATTVLVPDGAGEAAYRTGGGEQWVTVPEPPATGGPLQSGLVVGDAVALGGQLFNPETGTWSVLPALPSGAPGGVQAASSDTVLACSGDVTSAQGWCHLLRR